MGEATFKDTQLKSATGINAKVAPVIASTESLITSPAFDMVAPQISQPLADALSEFTTMMALSQNVLAGDFSVEVPDLKTVATQIATVKKQIALITPMLNTIGKTMTKLNGGGGK